MILYHYCSNAAFVSIIQQKRIRLSLLTLSNDAGEGQHLIKVVEDILIDEAEHRYGIIQELSMLLPKLSAIGFCLSAEKDQLSQWRGYADNGKGVAIGFDLSVLTEAVKAEKSDNIIFRVGPIDYGSRLSADIIRPLLEPVIKHFKSGEMKPRNFGSLRFAFGPEELEVEKVKYLTARSELFGMLIPILNMAFLIKSPFFQEEREWRILSIITSLSDELQIPNCSFRSSDNTIVPYLDFPTLGLKSEAIKEIILGPKNITPKPVIATMLRSCGFKTAVVEKSGGLYR